MNNPHIGRQLKKLMIDKDLGAKDLAERLGVSYQAVSQSLRKEDMNTRQIKKLAAAMNADIYEVLQA